MALGIDQNEQRRMLVAACRRAELSLDDLWTRYFALGGDAGAVEVDAFLHGILSLPPLQRDILAQAVNERLDDLASPRVPYTRTLREPRPETGPLAALVGLLEGARFAPPEQLPQVVAAAGRLFGVRVTTYLVDYDQRHLVPLPPADEGEGEPLGLDTTLAGRAFRQLEVVTGDPEGRPRLWVPLLDGAERLGVLDVMPVDGSDIRDPSLREQSEWLATLLGHVVTSTTLHGDALELVRRRRPRTPAAELVWGLLPPLTTETDSFALAGMLEPTYEVGGDAFDYAVSETTVSLAIFDAMGHGLGAGLLAAAALSAYRCARRQGGGLYEQARAIDETIEQEFGDDVFVTGVLAQVDLATGRTRYVVAGHPPPRVLRGGRVVRTLSGGARVPFGLDGAELTVGEEMLQPGDWIVLHTDGITEARDQHGAFFGEARLFDFLERQAASAHPPAETARRLVHSVMAHQDGMLQDDATVLLARWNTR